MTKTTAGCHVKVHYTGTLKDGTVFDSSLERDPLAFTVGAGQMIAGFDEGVLGMSEGEEKTIVLPPEKAYGPRNEQLLFAVGREQLPEGYEPSIGDQLSVTSAEGGVFPVTIAGLDEDVVTLDGNHRLAGEELTFKITMVEVTPA
ncbi:peptidylprolyl isomerase [Dethiosulfovibrio sp. F2B]|uniref:FKBP-type peptidyl-prolyl cis-trans isomerase n=1 Tax=Dethiosulfovibrio faecalis TaxID=2720018 RepID=UPI001F461D9C|nr:peptidylprolyl isomerase [Dethiosulfovibrio faecalis]MCF4152025.1 peptidylprolyl isomerase [Dethiosulfovibrio faecalis]